MRKLFLVGSFLALMASPRIAAACDDEGNDEHDLSIDVDVDVDIDMEANIDFDVPEVDDLQQQVDEKTEELRDRLQSRLDLLDERLAALGEEDDDGCDQPDDAD